MWGPVEAEEAEVQTPGGRCVRTVPDAKPVRTERGYSVPGSDPAVLSPLR